MCSDHAINDPAMAVDCPPAPAIHAPDNASTQPPKQGQKKLKVKNKDKPKKVTPPSAPGKKKDKGPPPEDVLHLPLSPYSTPTGTSGTNTPAEAVTEPAPLETPFDVPILDTHTHLLSTFSAYRSTYPEGKYTTLEEFVRAFYGPRPGEEKARVEAIVDVWCEAPVRPEWEEIANMPWWGVGEGKVGVEYKFVIGVHPHESKNYNDEVEAELLRASQHPRFVGIGEIGLDYHYTLSPKEVQQEALKRQLRLALKINDASSSGTAITIHTREAEEDTERILKEIVPRDYGKTRGDSTRGIHIHCFTDTPGFAQKLLEGWDNLYIGVTGVITFSTNTNTIELVKQMDAAKSDGAPLRIVLETDAPYMVPAAISSFPTLKALKKRYPLSHSGMIPWTAQFVANELNALTPGNDRWDTEKIMHEARRNAKNLYGV